MPRRKVFSYIGFVIERRRQLCHIPKQAVFFKTDSPEVSRRDSSMVWPHTTATANGFPMIAIMAPATVLMSTQLQQGDWRADRKCGKPAPKSRHTALISRRLTCIGTRHPGSVSGHLGGITLFASKCPVDGKVGVNHDCWSVENCVVQASIIAMPGNSLTILCLAKRGKLNGH